MDFAKRARTKLRGAESIAEFFHASGSVEDFARRGSRCEQDFRIFKILKLGASLVTHFRSPQNRKARRNSSIGTTDTLKPLMKTELRQMKFSEFSSTSFSVVPWLSCHLVRKKSDQLLRSRDGSHRQNGSVVDFFVRRGRL
jgi:hypothetical protein